MSHALSSKLTISISGKADEKELLARRVLAPALAAIGVVIAKVECNKHGAFLNIEVTAANAEAARSLAPDFALPIGGRDAVFAFGDVRPSLAPKPMLDGDIAGSELAPATAEFFEGLRELVLSRTEAAAVLAVSAEALLPRCRAPFAQAEEIARVVRAGAQARIVEIDRMLAEAGFKVAAP